MTFFLTFFEEFMHQRQCSIDLLLNRHLFVFVLFVFSGWVSDRLQDPSRPSSLLSSVQLLLDVLRRTLPAHGARGGLPFRELDHEMVPFDRLGVTCRRHSHLRRRQGLHSRRNQPVSLYTTFLTNLIDTSVPLLLFSMRIFSSIASVDNNPSSLSLDNSVHVMLYRSLLALNVSGMYTCWL